MKSGVRQHNKRENGFRKKIVQIFGNRKSIETCGKAHVKKRTKNCQLGELQRRAGFAARLNTALRYTFNGNMFNYHTKKSRNLYIDLEKNPRIPANQFLMLHELIALVLSSFHLRLGGIPEVSARLGPTHWSQPKPKGPIWNSTHQRSVSLTKTREQKSGRRNHSRTAWWSRSNSAAPFENPRRWLENR